jgi:hypothetical protein
MTPRPTFTDAERRARLARRHRLLPAARCDDVEHVARSLVGLHASDPVTVFLSATQRMRNGSIAAVEHALYERRSLMRHHAMRRTLWVLPLDLAMAAHSSTTMALVRQQRRRLADSLVRSGITDDPHGWIDAAGTALLKELAKRGEASTRELGEALPAYAVPLTLAGSPSASDRVGAHTRVLLLLGFVGAVVRTRPIGTWISGQYRWALSSIWTGREWSDDALPERGEAQETMVDAYLRCFGPATSIDVQWWMGWTKSAVVKALERAQAIEVDTERGPAYVAAGDIVPEPDDDRPWVALLPGLDPTTMGWKQRDWYLCDALAKHVFDGNGNAGPTVWADGQVVGAWAQRADGEIAIQWCQPVSATHERLAAGEVERLRGVIGDARFRVRFPSPLSRILAQ